MNLKYEILTKMQGVANLYTGLDFREENEA
jgi:hypothetical protein